MKDPLGVSPSKGSQGTTRGFDSHPGQKNIFFTSSGFPQWAIHGFNQHFNLSFRVNSMFHDLCSQCYAVQYSYVPLFSLCRDSPLKSSSTFSVRPRSSVGRVTVDLIRRSWVRFPPRSKDFFFTSCSSLIPFTTANAQWVIHGSISTLIYTSELILCSTICVHSATRHNIQRKSYTASQKANAMSSDEDKNDASE